jgi:hypothetical protein
MNHIKNCLKKIRYVVSGQKPVLFDHLPKCGGTTVGGFLQSAYPYDTIFRISGTFSLESIDDFKKLSLTQRKKIKLIYGHAADEIIDWANPNSICTTVVRHPVDRMVSHYYFVKRNTKHYLHDKVINENIQLHDYCHLNLSHELENWYVLHFSKLSKIDILKNPDKAVDLAYDYIKKTYHIVGFQNDIPSFIKELKKTANIGLRYVNHYKNKTDNRKSVTEIDENTVNRIIEKNKLDLKLYNKLLADRQF